jgi:hypothetical protein
VTDRKARHVVHAVHHIAGELLEQPLLDHHPRAAQPFLGRLEDEMDGAGEVGRGGESLGGAQQHGGVTVVAAGVHLVGYGRRVVERVLLLEMERIHVGAQPDRLLAGLVALERADHAGCREPTVDLEAPGLELLGHDLGRSYFLECRLGMAMDVAADGG